MAAVQRFTPGIRTECAGFAATGAKPDCLVHQIPEGVAMPTRSPAKADLPHRLLTIQDVADILQVSQRSVRRWIDAGDLVAHRIGRQWRVGQGDLETFIKLRRQA